MARSRFGLLTRLVAIGLLVWAATDLTFPQLCAEDSGATKQASSGPANSGPTQQDDCFCCCHHVVPTNLDFMTAFLFSVEVPDTRVVGLSLGNPRSLFHPPLFV